ncbi:ATP-binding protein [Pseudomonas sp. OV546]|uniref:ATP-binding protein n=1 Tax=Pseudomonas sp. OV546 TaxID=1881063 RepID=UPI0008EF4CE8|nr:ATP-binding protein [Pseudomonas sp. OV546]SFU97925.1 phage DNA replication protein (predicted replicative helicase loader) [Pseudomonas sp. OV546]
MRSEKVVSISDGVMPIRTQPADCEKHGKFDQKVTVILGRELKGGCPECLRVIAAEREASAKAEESYQLRLSLARKLGDALIPKRFLSRTLDNYHEEHEGQRRALKFCRHYVATFDQIRDAGRCMVLIGKPGTGKTHLGVAMANELLHKSSRTAVYRTFGAVLQAIRSTYDKSSDRTEGSILASLISPDLLVLDEIGVSKEQPSDFELTTLFAIINGRYEREAPTVIISNLKADELGRAMGDRCVDRLREGGLIVVPFDWESQRGKDGF